MKLKTSAVVANMGTFFLQAVLNSRQTGALAPSSPFLANLIAGQANLDQGREFLEIGPGTGVFTEELIRRLHPQARLTLIEKSESFAKLLRARFPELIIIEGCATELRQQLAGHAIHQMDSVICGLPWAAMPEDLQDALMAQIRALLGPGGIFVTFAYFGPHLLPAGRKFFKKLQANFATVSLTPIEFRNVPPAFVYRGVV